MTAKNSEREQDTQELVRVAKDAREKAYAPYSSFKVGAAVRTDDGRIFSGCNVENASYGATICAERVAVVSAIASGAKRIKAVAVIADYPTPVPPCGLCRQVIAEFGGDVEVVMANTDGATTVTSIRELLPYSFDLSIVNSGKT